MTPARHDLLRDERGISLPELVVALGMGVLIIVAAMTLLSVTNRSTARGVARVDANQSARPVMERIMDELRSTCISRGVVPVLSGTSGATSTPSSISFLHDRGTDVSPIPDKVTIDLVSGTLTERTYPASPTTPNSSGVWSFSSTPSSTRELLRNVGLATVNGAASTPLFQYYAYVNGVLTPLSATPSLSAADAARTVQVTVSMAVGPTRNPTADANAAVHISDTALLRPGPPSELATTANLPCA